LGLVLDLESFHYPGGGELFGQLRLELGKGQKVALVAGSGSGKSTLVTLMAGLHPQPLGGRPTYRTRTEPSIAREIAYLASDPALFLTGFSLTVLEEVGWSLFNRGWPPDQVEARVREVLAELGLEDLLWRHPQQLSGGEQQMVALASVWAGRPGYLLLDDPASKLDPQARLRLRDALVRLADEGVGILYATSVLDEVTWCDQVWSITAWQPELLEGRTYILPWVQQWMLGWGLAVPPWQAQGLPVKGSPPAPPAPAFTSDWAIAVKDLTYRPPGRQRDLFLDLSWQVRKGECVGLVGPNGAGKTTLARLVRGLLKPSQGSILVDGAPVAGRSVPSLAGAVAYTFQDPAPLFVKTRVDAELLYSGELLGWTQAQAQERADQALAQFGLESFAACHPRELPATASALLGVAISWYSKATVQILDEPLAGLDARGRALLEAVLVSWLEQGITVLLIAHDLDWLVKVCTSFCALQDGQIQAQGSASQLFRSEPVQASIGAPLLFQGD
jgi:energy-coupling factor transport system ATP-binding protein